MLPWFLEAILYCTSVRNFSNLLSIHLTKVELLETFYWFVIDELYDMNEHLFIFPKENVFNIIYSWEIEDILTSVNISSEKKHLGHFDCDICTSMQIFMPCVSGISFAWVHQKEINWGCERTIFTFMFFEKFTLMEKWNLSKSSLTKMW